MAWTVLHHLLETALANLTRKILASLDLQRCMAALESAVAHSSELTTQNNYKEHCNVFFIAIVNGIKKCCSYRITRMDFAKLLLL
jgi:hypothetical protein